LRRTFENTADFTNARFYYPPDFDGVGNASKIDLTGARIRFVPAGKWLHWTTDTQIPLRLRAFRTQSVIGCKLACSESRPYLSAMRKFPNTFSDILSIEHRWPKKGERLLRPSADPLSAVSFTPHQFSRDAFIWDGYMTAGAALIDEAERRPHDRYTLVYPILFNYRHGLESAMKWTIEQYGSLANIALDALDHDLWSL
jgi:hypothetical protein